MFKTRLLLITLSASLAHAQKGQEPANKILSGIKASYATHLKSTPPLNIKTPIPLPERSARQNIMFQRLQESAAEQDTPVMETLKEFIFEHIQAHPQDSQHLILLAKYYDYINAWPTCAALYSHLIARHANNTPLFETYLRYMQHVDQTQKARETAIQLFPYQQKNARYRALLVNLSLDLATPRPAIKKLTAYAKIHPNDAILFMQLGELYLANRETQQAKKAYIQAHSTGEAQPDTFLKLAELALKSQQKEEALAWLQQLNKQIGFTHFLTLFSDSPLNTELDLLDKIMETTPPKATPQEPPTTPNPSPKETNASHQASTP